MASPYLSISCFIALLLCHSRNNTLVGNDRYGRNHDISHSLFETGLELAESMQSILMTKEDLKTAVEASPRSTTPVAVDRNSRMISPDIVGRAIAILSTAWTEWIFTAKSIYICLK